MEQLTSIERPFKPLKTCNFIETREKRTHRANKHEDYSPEAESVHCIHRTIPHPEEEDNFDFDEKPRKAIELKKPESVGMELALDLGAGIDQGSIHCVVVSGIKGSRR